MNTTIDRTGCAAARHGTKTAYDCYGCHCSDARAAHRTYRADLRARRRKPAHDDGDTRRVQGMWAIGWPADSLAASLGWTVEQVEQVAHGLLLVDTAAVPAVRALFDRLAYTPGPSAEARAYAAQNGFVPAMAWDDIDRDEQPQGVTALVAAAWRNRSMGVGKPPTPDARCGTNAGAHAHQRRDEAVCDACRIAKNAYRDSLRQARRSAVAA